MSIRRVLLCALAISAVVLLAAGVFGCCVLSGPGHCGPATDHFDGRKFQNLEPVSERGGALGFWKWRLDRLSGRSKVGTWRPWTDAQPGPPPPRRVARGELRVTFVNHATTLVQMDGINVLTDPIWSERCSPVSWAGPRRARPPGIRFADLPPIDYVLISHNHYDHMDLPSLRRLAREHRPRVLVGLGNRPYLAREGVEGVVEMDWWQGFSLGDGLGVYAVPAQHFSMRGLCDRNRALWVGYVLTGPAGQVYFAGDTGYGAHFSEIRRRLGPIRLALLPIGAYRPRWFMSPVHISPEQAVRAHEDLQASTSVAIHFGTFALGDDGQDEPVRELEAALARRSAPRPRFWVLEFGEGRAVPATREPRRMSQ